jgi:hypothetical protein
MSKQSDINIQIDHLHSRAICDEIADRLRYILRQEAIPLPPRLRYLLDRLADADGELAPSIVPSFEDMFVRDEAIAALQGDAPAFADLKD